MQACQHEIRFESLFDAGRALCFPCDTQGQVDLNALSAHALENYLFARATVGREYAVPCITDANPCAPCCTQTAWT